MMITKYRVEPDQRQCNILVEETSVDSSVDCLSCPKDIVKMFNEVYRLKYLAEENVPMLAVNTRSMLLGVFLILHGTVRGSLLSPREVFIQLLPVGATNFIVTHNHPFGDYSPSNEDLAITQRLKECGNLINIALLDHIIVSSEGFYSFVSMIF